MASGVLASISSGVSAGFWKRLTGAVLTRIGRESDPAGFEGQRVKWPDRVKRLPAAEHYDAYLMARAVDFELMTAEEGGALSHADRSDYFAEAMVLGLRRNTSDEPRRDALDLMIKAERERRAARAIQGVNP